MKPEATGAHRVGDDSGERHKKTLTFKACAYVSSPCSGGAKGGQSHNPRDLRQTDSCDAVKKPYELSCL